MLEDIKKDATDRMAKCVAAYRNELKRLRTGRASTSLVDHIRVDYYGAESPLQQVANVAVEDARTITIVPYDKQMVSVIEKAIMKSDLGITPNTAGNVIRVPLPRADRGAPPRPDQGRQARGRERARRDPQRAPRRDAGPQGNAQGKAGLGGRSSARRTRKCRSSPTSSSPRSTHVLHEKEKELMQV